MSKEKLHNFINSVKSDEFAEAKSILTDVLATKTAEYVEGIEETTEGEG